MNTHNLFRMFALTLFVKNMAISFLYIICKKKKKTTTLELCSNSIKLLLLYIVFYFTSPTIIQNLNNKSKCKSKSYRII